MKRFRQGIIRALLFVFLFSAVFPALFFTASAETIYISQAVIAARAYYGDTSLSTVVLEDGVTSIGAKAFAESTVSDIYLPDSLTYIADNAFSGTALEYVHADKGTYAYEWMRDHGYIAEYRALVIGEQSFLWFYNEENADEGFRVDVQDQRNAADVKNFTAALGEVTGPHGAYGPDGGDFQVTQKTNLSYYDIRDEIKTVFADTRDQDISVFFIATHGDETDDGALRTAYTGSSYSDMEAIEEYRKHADLSFRTLAAWLNKSIKGRVFVVLESCGSGSAIYSSEEEENTGTESSSGDASGNATAKAKGEADEAFIRKAVEAFSNEDPGMVMAARQGNEPVLYLSTGDMRLPKFYVLAASRHQELSYGYETKEEETSYNFFTKWLIEGIGKKGASPADSSGNGDGFLSLLEMFNYVKQYDRIPDTSLYQHVQRYPANSTYELLKLGGYEPAPTLAPTPTPTATPAPTEEPTPTPEPTEEPSPTPSPRPTNTPKPVPQTGDSSHPALLLLMMLAALLVIYTAMRALKQNK